ncbi:hypothetical protein KSP39_PZI002108 [Platanthera zijinensis]|uniref:Uncharacterized protein n=1 Tax=Platanthera zijinensis TaxID=2320716 RepID=A0AAP0BYT8_9ASPA
MVQPIWKQLRDSKNACLKEGIFRTPCDEQFINGLPPESRTTRITLLTPEFVPSHKVACVVHLADNLICSYAFYFAFDECHNPRMDQGAHRLLHSELSREKDRPFLVLDLHRRQDLVQIDSSSVKNSSRRLHALLTNAVTGWSRLCLFQHFWCGERGAAACAEERRVTSWREMREEKTKGPQGWGDMSGG